MGPERWQQVERIYHTVSARPPEERAPLLRRECAGDSSLLVQESEGAHFTHSDVGRQFGDLDTPRKVWPDLPE